MAGGNYTPESVFQELMTVISRQQKLINALANKLEQLEIGAGGGGTGNASIEDYESGKLYQRNVLVVDPETETVYRVLHEYESVTVEIDRATRHLKLVGYESQFVTFNHEPSQAEIDTLPEDVLVATYSTTDDPYTPVISGDNPVNNG